MISQTSKLRCLQPSFSTGLVRRLHQTLNQSITTTARCITLPDPPPRDACPWTSSRRSHGRTLQNNNSTSASNQMNGENLYTTTNSWHNLTAKRSMSDGLTRGTDLLADSLAHGPRRKIILESYAPSGVDVKGLIQVGDVPAEGDLTGGDKIVHMNGSVVAFPDACFLWNVETVQQVTLASLSVVKLYRPTVEYLFIGCDKPLLPPDLNKIRKEFQKNEIVVEQMDIMNAMGTFNILNGEDRRVACVLVIDPNEGS